MLVKYQQEVACLTKAKGWLAKTLTYRKLFKYASKCDIKNSS